MTRIAELQRLIVELDEMGCWGLAGTFHAILEEVYRDLES